MAHHADERMKRPTLSAEGGVRGFERALLILSPLPYLVFLVAFTELVRLPRSLVLGSPRALVALFGRSVFDQGASFWMLGAALSMVALAIVGKASSPRLGSFFAAVVVVASSILAIESYGMLVRYPRFGGYIPFICGFCAFGLYLSFVYICIIFRFLNTKWTVVSACVGLLVTIGVQIANQLLYRDAYPTLHFAALAVTVFLGHAATAQLSCLIERPRRFIGLSFVFGLVLTLAVTRDAPAFANPYYLSKTILGQVTRLRETPAEPACSSSPTLDPEHADMVFREFSGLPQLPESFHVDDLNVLFVMVEALRVDETFIFSVPGNTPRLAALAADGSFTFERAYAPSSLTLASVSSLMSMSYPSAAPLTVRNPRWNGVLRAEALTLAEHFADAGYTTFRSVHRMGHDDSMQGLGQGFAESHIQKSVDPGKSIEHDADEAIATQAIEQIRTRASSRKPFFGFVFFEGPHEPYVSHGGEAQTDRDLYREEVANTDAQIGRLVDALREMDLLRRTVVVVAGDHGEEFGEHGGSGHARTLYEESIRVPLVVRVPGIHGKRRTALTSTLYVFPWLLRTARGPLREIATDIVRRELAPVLHATGGAVVSELLGADRRRTALVYPDFKLVYDDLSGMLEAFRLDRDPHEQEDLAVVVPPDLEAWMSQVDSYRKMRACKRRFVLE